MIRRPPVRNLMFFCYPRTAGGHWRRSVERLLEHWSLFTGRKLVTIAVDGCCDLPADVERAFGAVAGECELRVVDNLIDPNRESFRGMQGGLQEASHFGPMLHDLETDDEHEITLYCHAKGATHADPDAPSHKWREAMASACLEFPRLVDCTMREKNICGAFRVHAGWGFPGYHDWHFAGTWYWFRNARAKQLGLRDCQPVFYGTEAWPGAFPKSEGACLFFDNANSGQLYQNDFWRDTVSPSLRYWRSGVAAAIAASSTRE